MNSSFHTSCVHTLFLCGSIAPLQPFPVLKRLDISLSVLLANYAHIHFGSIEGKGSMCKLAIVLTLYSTSLRVFVVPSQHSVDHAEKLTRYCYKLVNKEEVSPCAVRKIRARKEKSIPIQHFHVSRAIINGPMKRTKSDSPASANVISVARPKRYSSAGIVDVS
jgi:hypothetical protein